MLVCGPTVGPKWARGQQLSSFRLHAGDDMRIGVECERDGGMSGPLGDDSGSPIPRGVPEVLL